MTLDGYVYGLDALGLWTNVTSQLGLTTNTVPIGYAPIDELAKWTGTTGNRCQLTSFLISAKLPCV